MTIPSKQSVEIGHRLPSKNERDAAKQLGRMLTAPLGNDTTHLITDATAGESIDLALTPALSALLVEVLSIVGRGDAVSLTPISQTLTSHQAASILNVSPSYLAQLLKKGDIDSSLVGRRRHIKAADVFIYKRNRDAQRASTLAKLAETDADLL